MSTNRFATLEPKTHQNGKPEPRADRGKTKAPPSSNGDSQVAEYGTAPHPQPLSPGGRGEHGRFAPGNSGGPGNPFGRLAAALRRELLETTSADDIRQIAMKLLEMAKAGNVPAAKLLLSYTIGKPTPASNPDSLDVEEWQLFKDTAPMLRELSEIRQTPDPFVPLNLARASREATTCDLASMFGFRLGLPEQSPGLLNKLDAMTKEEEAEVLRGLAREMREKKGKQGAAPCTGQAGKKTPNLENGK